MVDFAGAAIGAVFGELLVLAREATKKTLMFKDLLEQLKSDLETIAPIIEENKVLDRPKQETQKLTKKMEKGKKLVSKCSTIRKLNCVVRYYYARKLIKLDKWIVRFFQVDIQALVLRNTNKTLANVNEINHNLIGNNCRVVKHVDFGCSVPEPPVNTLGFDVPLVELKRDLLKKDGVQVIVVSAAGGFGKTTLVTKLCKDNDVKGKFGDNIFFVIVSEKHDVKVIVQQIFKHMGYDVPHIRKDEEAFNHLEQMLKRIGKPILLVLDDVWSGSESLLRKLKFQLPNYKILVTSRSVFPEFGHGHSLKPLDDIAAKKLFLDSAIPEGGNSYVPDEDLVDKIVQACKGSPLALTVLGKAHCGELAAVWKRTANEMDQGVSIFDSKSNADLLNCLQRSLVVLDDDVKECFMDLGSFPEDQRIPITALIDMWSELYKPSVEDGLHAFTNLHQLSKRSLVNLVVTRKNESDDGYYNDHIVMLHDLLRELAIYQSMSGPVEETKRLIIDMSGNNFPKWWSEQKQQPINARLLSISTDETFSSSWHNMEVPEVEVVVLNIRSMKYILPNFMEKMDKLKVLIVTNYGFFPTEVSNFELVGSLSNLKRIRLEHVSIPSSGMTMVPMMNLQKISFIMCNVGEAFRNSTLKISDAFPNLLELEIDYCSDMVELPDGLCDIVCMKKLSISNCHKLSKLPEDIGQLVNLEMLRLVSCTELSALPASIGSLSNLNFLDISDCLSIHELPIQIGELCSLKTLCIRRCSSFKEPSLIFEIKNLKVVKCNEEMAYGLERFRPEHVKIEVVKDDINLYWLRNPNHF